MHDMTKAERLADKKLVEQAKELEANDPSGNLVVRVMGPPWDRKLLKKIQKKVMDANLESFKTNHKFINKNKVVLKKNKNSN